jgi:alkylhydroperoxidase family enzyme
MREAFAVLSPPADRPRPEGRPKGLNALGMLAWHPQLAHAYNIFTGQMLYGSTLTPRQRELLVLRVAAVRDSQYEWAQHVASAADNDIDADEVERIAVGPEAPGWSDLERALLRAVDELVVDALIGNETWALLAAELEEQQLMDLVFTVGVYEVFAMALRTFAVPLDDDLKPQ